MLLIDSSIKTLRIEKRREEYVKRIHQYVGGLYSISSHSSEIGLGFSWGGYISSIIVFVISFG